LFFGVAGVLFEQLALDFLGDFEGEEFVGMFFGTIFEIAERLAGLHVEGVEFSLRIIELSTNLLEVGVRLFGKRHDKSFHWGNNYTIVPHFACSHNIKFAPF